MSESRVHPSLRCCAGVRFSEHGSGYWFHVSPEIIYVIVTVEIFGRILCKEFVVQFRSMVFMSPVFPLCRFTKPETAYASIASD